MEDCLTLVKGEVDLQSFEGYSFNNKLILEVYKEGKVIKSKLENGFAHIDQRMGIKPLKLLVAAKLNNGTIVPKGYKAYIKESDLFSQPWAKKVLESDVLDDKFIVVDLQNVEFILS